MITDEDLDEDPELLSHFRALAIVGHSEYWSDRARDGLAAYLDSGGQVLCLSGDTLSVRVSYDADRSEMECRKIVYDDDPRWLAPAPLG
jgi:hypothetical protein